MASIKVVWRPITTVGLPVGNPPYHHQFLLYDDGAGNLQYIRGGPLNEGDLTRLINDRWGSIVTQWGPYEPGTADFPTGQNPLDQLANWPQQEVMTGNADLVSEMWDSMVNDADLIGQEGIKYNKWEKNSNSVISDILENQNIEVPNSDANSGHYAPGYEYNLNNLVLLDGPIAPFEAEHPNPLREADPLVFDLDGDGIELVSVNDSNAHFDYAGTGFAPKTGWVSASEGMLIREVNQDPSVTAVELFGAISGNAFEDLRAFDLNQDARIDNSDAVFSSLRIWIDADGDGVGDNGEFFELPNIGIKAINLGVVASGEQLNGNRVVETGSFVRDDDTIGTVAEVNFATDTLYTRFTPPTGFEYSLTALDLPNLVGYGNVPDLVYSMSENSDLEDAVLEFVLQSEPLSASAYLTAFENILQKWAGVDEVDPTSRGPLINARHLALVEAFYGASFEQVNGVGAILNSLTAESIEATYTSIVDSMLVRFVTQAVPAQLYWGGNLAAVQESPLLPFDSIKFDDASDSIQVDFDDLVLRIEEGAQTAVDKVSYYTLAGVVLRGLRVDLFGESNSAMSAAFVAAAATAGVAAGVQGYMVALLTMDRLIEAESVVGAVNGTDLSEVIVADGQDRVLSGAGNADAYIYSNGNGNVTIDDGAISDGDHLILVDVAANGVVLSRNGASENLTVSVVGGNTITIDGQFNKLGSGTIETISFADGNPLTAEDVMQRVLTEGKTTGNDAIYGFFREDVLDGGAGDDYLAGAEEGDTYIWGAGEGNDTIYDLSSGVPQGANIDRIEMLSGIELGDLQFARGVGTDDLVITITSTGETLTVVDQFLKFATGTIATEIEEIVFSDESVLTAEDVRELVLTQAKTAGDDDIVAFHTADTLDGGAGNDTMVGNGGGDTFVFGLGYGQDVVDAYIVYVTRDEPDRILFNADVAPEDIVLSRSGDDLILSISGTDDRLTIADHFSSLGYREVEEFHFADETVWTAADILLRMIAGTAGDDVLIGGTDADYLDGGAGNDVLKGRQGDDTYVFGIGYGRDTIDDDNNSLIGDAPDRLLFGAGIDMEDLEFVKVGTEDLVVRILGTEDEVTIKRHYTPVFSISNFELADGTTFTAADVETIIQQQGAGIVTHRGISAAETINGTDEADIIDGLGGADTLLGGWGSDTYLFGVGSGNDVVEEDGLSNDVDTIKLVGLDPSDVLVGRNGNDLYITIISSNEVLKVTNHFNSQGDGIEKVVFSDTTVWDRTTIQAQAIMLGTEGAETINGSGAADTIDGLGGADTLQGGWGGDTYIYRVGSGNDSIIESGLTNDVDKVRLVDLDPSDVTLARVGYHLYITIVSSGEQLTVQNHFNTTNQGIEQLIFGDNTTWDRTTIQANAVLTGTSSAETLTGTGAAEIIDGLGGNDNLNGGGGGDTYIFDVGSGNDTIGENSDGTAVDKVRLVGLDPADVTFSRTGDHLFITITSSGEQLKITDHFWSTTYGVEQLIFDDNVVWNRTAILLEVPQVGTSGNDSISGTGRDNSFKGGLGNDTLLGSSGSDYYIYASGDGNDKVDDESWQAVDVDVLWFTDINAGDITLTRSGNDLMVNVTATGHQIEVDELYWNTTDYYGVDQFRFGDGTTWNRDQIIQNAWWSGTSGNDTISGWGLVDNINGGNGNDTLSGNAGADTIVGGSGNDTLSGGSGNDVFVFGSGFGVDTVSDFTGGAGAGDVIEFRDGLVADFTALQSISAQVGSNVVITVDGSNSITLQNVTLANLDQDDFRFF